MKLFGEFLGKMKITDDGGAPLLVRAGDNEAFEVAIFCDQAAIGRGRCSQGKLGRPKATARTPWSPPRPE